MVLPSGRMHSDDLPQLFLYGLLGKPDIEDKKKSAHPEAKGLFFLSVALVMLLTLLTFKAGQPQKNCLGLVGYSLAWTLGYLFGLTSYLISLFIGWMGWKLLTQQ